jgi:c-di-GMP-binding flagellar brake protein YcgR
MQVGKYLIVQLSDQTGRKTQLKEGEHLTVKYILSDDVFGFNSHIIRTLQDPDDLVFLEYPREVESCNIRAKKRVKCFLPIRMLLDQTCLNGSIFNINETGCLCTVDTSPLGDGIRTHLVHLELAYGQFETLLIKGEIRNSRQEGELTRFGIRFDSLDRFSKQVLTTLVPSLKI